jgi:hypothetical protein
MEYSSSSSPSSSSDDDEATFAALKATVNVITGAAQVVIDSIDAEEAESMELDALDDSSSDDDEDESTWGGSVPGRSKVYRDFEGAYLNLLKMYFSGEESVYCALKCLKDDLACLERFLMKYSYPKGYRIFQKEVQSCEQAVGSLPPCSILCCVAHAGVWFSG